MKYININGDESHSKPVLTSVILKTLEPLDSYFEGFPVIVTSGVRNIKQQIDIILDKIKNHGLLEKFPELEEFIEAPADFKFSTDKYESIYWWQPAWSWLLHIGEIVNPPLTAKVLEDYISGGVNKKGIKINPSTHFLGNAFDIGGGKDINEAERRIDRAKHEGKCFIYSYRKEMGNNCVHINCTI